MTETLTAWLFDPTVGKLAMAGVGIVVIMGLTGIAQHTLGRYMETVEVRRVCCCPLRLQCQANAVALVAFCVTLPFLGGLARADEPSPPASIAARAETAGAAPEDDLAAKKAAVGSELAEARQQLLAATDDSQETLRQAVPLLETLDGLYARYLAAQAEEADRTLERARVEGELVAEQSGPVPPAPYSLLQLDAARDELESERKRGTTLAASVAAAEDSVERATKLLDQRERARRETKEALETNTDPAAPARLGRALRIRQLESRVATEQLHLRELDLRNLRATADIQRLRVHLLQQREERIGAAAQFSRDDLQDKLVQIDKQAADLKQTLATAKQELPVAEQQWARVKQQIDSVAEPARALTERVEARRLAQQTRQLAVTILEQRLQWLTAAKEAWNQRFVIANGGVPRPQAAAWARQTTQTLEELEREERVQRARRTELADVRATRRDVLPGAELSPDAERWVREQRRELDDQVDLTDSLLTSLDDQRRVLARLLHDLDATLGTGAFGDRVRATVETIPKIWGYEITSIDDRPITVGKIVVGLLLLGLGVRLSRYLSRQLGRRVFPRLGIEAGAAAALQSLSFYFFVSVLTLFALNIINVPLTAFTLLGGALAIGLGFGSQNIVNNFISGLILFAERPIRIGDMIEVDGTYGTVEHIGARSTRVRTFRNIDIIVPNSAFLEKNVINWTLSDDQIRTNVTVGVAYGSPTRTVAQVIRRCVDGHDEILKRPEPIVLFSEFGDSALLFEVHFWIRMRRQMSRRIIESDVRHRLAELFCEAGIAIAFPQRDVHLDSVRPVEIRVVSDVPSKEQPRQKENG